MKEQETPIPTGPVELDLFADETTAAPAVEPQGTAAETDVPPAAPAEPTPSADAEASADAAATTESTVRADKPRKKKKKKKRPQEPQKSKGFFEQINDFVNEDEDQPININIRGLLGGDGLPNFFRRNWVFISVIVFFTCCYVTCRYMMQSAVLEHDKLTKQLVDRKYKNLTLDCELLEHTLGSHVEKSLRDSTIHTPTEQSFVLKTEE